MKANSKIEKPYKTRGTPTVPRFVYEELQTDYESLGRLYAASKKYCAELKEKIKLDAMLIV